METSSLPVFEGCKLKVYARFFIAFEQGGIFVVLHLL
jgi:hypothetical protein